MRVLTILCAVIALATTGPGAPAAIAQTPFAPVAVVNDDVITGYDLDQRMRLIRLFARGGDDQALQQAALDQLVEDRLKLQAGERLGIAAGDELIAEALETFATTRQTTPEALRAAAAKAGVSDLALRDLVAADAVWREVVRGRFLGRVEPSAGEVDAEIGLIGQGGGTTAYRLQEIGLPVRQGREAETKALADRLYAELAAGGDFAAAVRQHSRAPTAAQDGNLGWVQGSQIPPGLAQSLDGLQPGQVTPPVRVPAGFSIVKLLERSEAGAGGTDVSPEARERVRAKMIDTRLGRLAEGLMQELRRDALIEIR